MTIERDTDFASDEEMREAVDPAVGAGTRDDAPDEDPVVGLLGRQPLAVLGLLALLANCILVSVPGLPTWATAVCMVVISLAAGLGIWKRVTPVADPKLGAGLPLALRDPSPPA